MLALIVVLAAGLAVTGNFAFAQPVTSSDECLPGSMVHCIDPIADIFGTNNINGTISSMLMPVNDTMSGSMSMAEPARQQAMRFSMAQDVTWILGGNWSLTRAETNGSKTVNFEAAFAKIATDGSMRHTHRITNFTLSPDLGYSVFKTEPPILSISGTADLYFNDELAWKQAGISLQESNGVLTIKFDSADIDNHFHDMPIYGVIK